MTEEEFKEFCSGGQRVVTRPETHFAKKIASIREMTRGKVSYQYDRWHRVRFVDGTALDVGNDYINGHTKMAPGGYVIGVRPDWTWGFLTEEQFRVRYQ